MVTCINLNDGDIQYCLYCKEHGDILAYFSSLEYAGPLSQIIQGHSACPLEVIEVKDARTIIVDVQGFIHETK